jgi:hypothetical protein
VRFAAPALWTHHLEALTSWTALLALRIEAAMGISSASARRDLHLAPPVADAEH